MDVVQAVTTVDEVNAAIIKGFLESNGIKASYSPRMNRNGRARSCDVYMFEDKLAEATELLKKQGLIQ